MHASGSGGYYRGKLNLDINDYLTDMVDIFGDKVYRVTKEGGYCCIVIANEVVNGTILPLPHMLLSRLVVPFGKWQLHEEIIWHKVTGGTNRYGSFVINPYPKYYRANIMHEFILILRKATSTAAGHKEKMRFLRRTKNGQKKLPTRYGTSRLSLQATSNTLARIQKKSRTV